MKQLIVNVLRNLSENENERLNKKVLLLIIETETKIFFLMYMEGLIKDLNYYL